VHVPVAAVYEYDFLPARKNEVRAAGQIPPMQAETVAQRMDQLSDSEFRLRILRPDALHVLSALSRRENIHHA